MLAVGRIFQHQFVHALQACLIAIYELKTSTADIFRLPDVSQPSVYHQPASSNAGKVCCCNMHACKTLLTQLDFPLCRCSSFVLRLKGLTACLKAMAQGIGWI